MKRRACFAGSAILAGAGLALGDVWCMLAALALATILAGEPHD